MCNAMLAWTHALNYARQLSGNVLTHLSLLQPHPWNRCLRCGSPCSLMQSVIATKSASSFNSPWTFSSHGNVGAHSKKTHLPGHSLSSTSSPQRSRRPTILYRAPRPLAFQPHCTQRAASQQMKHGGAGQCCSQSCCAQSCHHQHCRSSAVRKYQSWDPRRGT